MTINYVDGAGHPQTVIGNLDFEVLDDGPKLTGASIGRVVEEEALDMSAPAGAFPVLSDGNPDDFNDQFPNPDIDPESPEDASQPNSAVVSGNLGSSVIVGADSPGTWSVIGTNGLPDLYSQGDQVMYRQVGNTIEAYVERSGGDETAVEQIVFTFELQTNGDYTFTIFDQLDHVAPDGELLLADENVELRTSGPDEPVTFVSDIDFSQTIQVVDSDNDPLVLGPETLTFTMVDDVPVLSLSEIEYDGDEAYQGVLFGDVQEDALGNEDETLSTELTPYNDSSTGNLEDPPGDTDTATVDLSSLVNFSIGADEYPDPEETGLTYSITELEGGKQMSAYTSNGKEVWYFKEGDNLVARAGDGGVEDGTVVFTVSVVSDTGLLTFDLDDQLDHLVTDDAQKGDSGVLAVNDFGQYVQAEVVDYDNDSVFATFDGRIEISVENDVPEVVETAQFYYVSEYAGYDNIIGTYTLDEGDNPTDLQIIIPSSNAEGDGAEPDSPLGVSKGALGSDAKIFIIANGGNQDGLVTNLASTVLYDGTLTIDGVTVTKPVYFMDKGLNLNEGADGQPVGNYDHFMNHYRDIITESPIYGGEVGIEDLNLGDADYDDTVLRIEKGPVVTESALTGGSGGVGTDGKTELATQTLTASGNFFEAGDSSMIQIKSGADEPLKLVLESTTIPEADGSSTDRAVINTTAGNEFWIDPSNAPNGVFVTVDSEAGTLEVWDNGDWKYTLNENTLKHPDNDPSGSAGNDGDYDRFSSDQVQDVFNLHISDFDGDEVATRLIININDDGPVAADDFASVVEGQSVFGDVVDGDTIGGVADNYGADGKTGTSAAGAFYDPDSDTYKTSGTITGDYGVLTINDSDGSYTYQANANLDQDQGPLKDIFTYRITDGDGDQDTATLTIDVTDGIGSSSEGTSLLVDEALITDSDSVPALSFTAGSADLVSFAFSDDIAGLAVDVNGDSVNDLFWYRADDTTINGYVDGNNTTGTLAITLALTNPGTISAGQTAAVEVTATLTDALVHPAAGGAQTVYVGSVNVVGTDTNNVQTSAPVAVSVIDDVPGIGVPQDALLANETGNSVTGSLDIDSGADDPVSIVLGLTDGANVVNSDGTPQYFTSDGLPLVWRQASDDEWYAETKSTPEGEEGPIRAFTVTVDQEAGTYTVFQDNGIDGKTTSQTISFDQALGGGNNDQEVFGRGSAIDTNAPATTFSDGIYIFATASDDNEFDFGWDDGTNTDTYTPENTVNYSNQGIGSGGGAMFINDVAPVVPGTTGSEILSFKLYDVITFVRPTNKTVAVDESQSTLANLTAASVTIDHLGQQEGANYSLWYTDPNDIDAGAVLVMEGSVPTADIINPGTGSSSPSDLVTLDISSATPFNEIRFESEPADGFDSSGYRIVDLTITETTEGTNMNVEIPFYVVDADGDMVSTDANGEDASFSVTFDGNGDLNAVEADAIDGDVSTSGMAISGSSGNDVIIGTDYDDTIDGGGGNDVIYGDASDNAVGNDYIVGGDGNDVIYGDDPESLVGGNDVLIGGDGIDDLYGGAGADVLVGDIVNTESGNPNVILPDSPDSNDNLFGGDGEDIAFNDTSTGLETDNINSASDEGDTGGGVFEDPLDYLIPPPDDAA